MLCSTLICQPVRPTVSVKRMGSEKNEEYLHYASKSQKIRGLFSRSVKITPSSKSSEIRSFILSDQYLKDAYSEMYLALRSSLPKNKDGVIIEVGAGSGVGKIWIPEIYCTDLRIELGIDIVFDGTRMPFADQSVCAFVMKDSLHHLANVEKFLDEASRCLKVGGAVVACEPYWGLLASFIYRFLHPEPFNKKQLIWNRVSRDAWDSNQALPWIILRRDVRQLREGWPELEVRELGPILGPSYLLSGGVFGRTFIPSSLLTKLRNREAMWGRWFNPFRFEFVFSLTKQDRFMPATQENSSVHSTQNVD